MKSKSLSYGVVLALIAFLLVMPTSALAGRLSLPQVLSSGMVLQQGRDIPVWGMASPGERVTVSFSGRRISARADKDGCWQVSLPPMKADSRPQKMTVKGKDTIIVLDSILIGEVWLCSGQSNMAYKMRRGKYAAPGKGNDLAAEELQKPADTMIRVFVVRRDGKPARWHEAGGDDLAESSAVGYYFGKSVRKQLDVPVGIITSAIGGTRIEAWTPAEAYAQSPAFSGELTAGGGRIDGKATGDLFGKMILPLAPFAVKGFLWYQGESNITDCGRERRYAEKFALLADSWREAFKADDAPFYYVLLAPYLYSARNPKNGGIPSTAEELPLFWQQQISIHENVPNTDFACVWDMVDNVRDIHPSYKWRVGERMSRMALAKDYGMTDMEYSGPRAYEAAVSGDSVIVTFRHAANGLKSSDKKRLSWFEVAGADGVFRPALADIRGDNKVRVWHADIKNPVQVRFGWHETAMPNLSNSEGLPAVPFVLSVKNNR